MKTPLLYILLGYTLGAGIAGFSCHAADITSQFEAANRLYEQGKFDEAIVAYQKLIESGVVSSALYFNLGNACFKSGQLGRAIAAYRAAQQLNPRDPDIQANLQFARNQVQQPTITMSKTVQRFSSLAPDEWVKIAAAVFWALFVLLIIGEAKPKLKLRMRPFAWLVGGIFVMICAFGILAHLVQLSTNKIVVVVEPEVVVKQGPLDDALKAFVVHDGAELKILDQKNDWLQVSVGPGRFGWVKRASVVFPAEMHTPHTSHKTTG